MNPESVSHVESKTTDTHVGPFPFEKLPSLLLRFLNRLKQTGKSSHTISAYRNDLSTFIQFLVEKKVDPRIQVTGADLEWVSYLKETGRRSLASVRRAQMSVRTFMHFLVGEKFISGSPFLDVKSPTQPKHDLFIVSHDHFAKLVATLELRCKDGDEKAVRDLVLTLLLGECGLKASEAAALMWKDLFLEGEGGTVRIAGPNERLLKISKQTRVALEELHELRENLSLPCDPQSKLFFGYMNVSRKTRTLSLHRHGIKFVIYEACEEILGVPYNSESLRNHAILRWLDQGLPSTLVAKMAGYSSLNSLERFRSQTRRKARRSPRRKLEEGRVAE